MQRTIAAAAIKPRMPSVRSCYISAPLGEDTTVLRRVLKDLGVRVIDAFDLGPGIALSAGLTARIAQSDAVIAIYSDHSTNVGFELGAAAALDKPTFVIVPPEATIPSYVQQMIYLRSNLKDTPVLRNSIMRFLKHADAPERKRPASPRKVRTSGSAGESAAARKADMYSPESTGISLARQEIEAINTSIANLRSTAAPRELERLVLDGLKRAGLHLETSDGRGADAVVWSQRLTRSVGNPILIEIKVGIIDDERLEQTEEQLKQYLSAAEASFGLLLYLDRDGRRHPIRGRYPQILRVDATDFLDRLMRSSFERALLRVRDEAAHHSSAN